MKLPKVLTFFPWLTSSVVRSITVDEHVSVDGLLDVLLEVDMVESLDGGRIAPGFNGKSMGPTLRVKPGDTVKVTLVNNLEPSSQNDLDLLAYTMDITSDEINSTMITNRLTTQGFIYNPTFGFWGQNFMTLHFHGANVDPKAENSLLVVDGRESKSYTFQIPDDQPPGLAWYHNHNHGTSQYSMMSGLYGFMVIEGTEQDITTFPMVDDSTEVFLMLAESSINPETKSVNPLIPVVMEFGWKSVTNGELGENATFTFEKGKKILFRAASASVEPAKILSIDDHMLLPIAFDGHPARSLEKSETVIIDAGARVEFMTIFDTPGTYIMRLTPWNTGIDNEEACTEAFGITLPKCVSYNVKRIAATIIVTDKGTSDEVFFPEQIQDYHPFLIELASKPSVQSRTITLDQAFVPPIFNFPFDPLVESGGVPSAFGINGRFYSVHDVHGEIEQGTCETWEVSSNNPTVGHTFHIHSVPFLVKQVDGIDASTPYWRDTMPVFHNMTIHVCFPRYDGNVLVHCHMPSHQDIGMGAFYKVLPMETKDDIPNTTDEIDDMPTATEENDDMSPGASSVSNFSSYFVFFAIAATLIAYIL